MAEFISVALVASVIIVIVFTISVVVYVNHDKANIFEVWEGRRFRELEVTDESEKDLYRNTFEWTWMQFRYSLRGFLVTVGEIVIKILKSIKEKII